jgi:hypothetical protein
MSTKKAREPQRILKQGHEGTFMFPKIPPLEKWALCIRAAPHVPINITIGETFIGNLRRVLLK